jgi:hypothetical protein
LILFDTVLLKCLSLIDNLKRLMLVTVPHSIILIIAILYKNQLISDSSNAISAKSSSEIFSIFITIVPSLSNSLI